MAHVDLFHCSDAHLEEIINILHDFHQYIIFKEDHQESLQFLETLDIDVGSLETGSGSTSGSKSKSSKESSETNAKDEKKEMEDNEKEKEKEKKLKAGACRYIIYYVLFYCIYCCVKQDREISHYL